jgi:hypothetical protein
MSSFYANFHYEQILIGALYATFVRRKGMYLRTWGSFKFENRKSAKGHIYGMSANLTNYLRPQICGFAICATYLRIASLSGWPYFILVPIVAAAKENSNFVASRPILQPKHWQCNFFKDRNFVSKCQTMLQPFPMVKCFLSYGKNKNTKYNLCRRNKYTTLQ